MKRYADRGRKETEEWNEPLSQKRSFSVPLKVATIHQPLDQTNCPRDILKKSPRMKNALTS